MLEISICVRPILIAGCHSGKAWGETAVSRAETVDEPPPFFWKDQTNPKEDGKKTKKALLYFPSYRLVHRYFTVVYHILS